MLYIIKRLRKLIIIVIIITALFFYWGVFSPLRTELQSSLRKEFERSVTITEHNVENTFNRYIEGAESISSRTMIKNKLAQYLNSEISLNKLKNYTDEKYSDGIRVLDNILGAYRISNNKIISSWGEENIKNLEDDIKFNNRKTQIKILEDELYFLVNSPIIKNEVKLGNDILIYKLKDILNEINKQNIKYNIIYDNNLEKERLIIGDNIKDFRRLLNTNYWLKAKMPKKDLYNTLNSLSIKIIGGFIILLILIITIFYKTLNYTSKEVIKNLKMKAEIDEMLNIYNRTKFMEKLKLETERSHRYKSDVSLIMFDVDYFKEINDNYGHLVGDDILKSLINIVKNEIREVDFLARYGGDEFIIINPETKLKESVKLAERLRFKIENSEFEKIDKVSCSFGVAELREDDDIDSFIKRVDDALYEAKEKGRNKVIKG
ncbi:MAG TPA: GGDEF domain-containing protein [Halanaerobiales bacterium]|nr:GGDEF domain-containing protein [Halanaerobiales bacterium]